MTPLTAWYAKHGRHDLPWRKTRDAYAIWVSEIMLQQTQVATVEARFYAPFLRQFPTVRALAVAPRESVLKAWEGLGYYRRANHLHEAAQACAPHYILPTTVEGLMALKGIGRNTAHAIAAFACGARVPVMEANVRRVLCRLFAVTEPNDAALFHHAAALMEDADPFAHNQAMMDLGAMICTPKAPRCGECPLAPRCAGKHAAESYPKKRRKAAVPVRPCTIVVVADREGRYHMTPRNSAFLSGLYSFPTAPGDARSITVGEQIIPRHDWLPLGGVTQTYSHFQTQASVWLIRLSERAHGPAWFPAAKAAALPVSGLEKKIFALLDEYAPASDSAA